MKNAIAAFMIIVSLGGCTAGIATYRLSTNLEPIPGSITYGGQPRTKRTKAPVGSIVPHRRWQTFDFFSDD